MADDKFLNRGVHVDPSNPPPNLTRNELTRSAKKQHLARIGIKGEDAEKILTKLYGAGP